MTHTISHGVHPAASAGIDTEAQYERGESDQDGKEAQKEKQKREQEKGQPKR